MSSPPFNVDPIGVNTDDFIEESFDDSLTVDDISSDEWMTPSPRLSLPVQIIYVMDDSDIIPTTHQKLFHTIKSSGLNIKVVLLAPSSSPPTIRTKFPIFDDYCFARDVEVQARFCLARHGTPALIIGTFDIYRLFAFYTRGDVPECLNIGFIKLNTLIKRMEEDLLRIRYQKDIEGVVYDPTWSDLDFEVATSPEREQPVKIFFDLVYSNKAKRVAF